MFETLSPEDFPTLALSLIECTKVMPAAFWSVEMGPKSVVKINISHGFIVLTSYLTMLPSFGLLAQATWDADGNYFPLGAVALLMFAYRGFFFFVR